MTLIAFRHLPAVTAVEEQLRLQSRGLLAEEEAEELPHLIDDASRELFGITANDTLYAALPEMVRAKYGRAEWEAHFAALAQCARDPNAQWRTFGLDLCCDEGRSLHCLQVFGRQLVCALHSLHPKAILAFIDPAIAKAA
jgi:hypothetical protein